MLQARDVARGPRRYRLGAAPAGGIHPAAFGLCAAGAHHELSRLRLRRARDRWRLGDYFAALEDALGPDWLSRPAPCTVDECLRHGSPVSLAAPCLRFGCPSNLLGHLDRLGLVVLYHRDVSGRLTCTRQLGPGPTLAEVGRALGVSRERVRQMEAAALARLRATFRRR